ncbi:hypothetical protein GCM10020001_006270 [Nonomuraea salmonea]
MRAARPDAFEWTFGLDPATIDERMLAGQGTDADAIGQSIQAATVARVQTPQIKARTLSGLNGCTTYMGLNTTKKYLKDVRVRQAINHAIDKDTIVAAMGGSTLAEKGTSIQPPTVAGRVDYDPYPPRRRQGQATAGRRRPVGRLLADPRHQGTAEDGRRLGRRAGGTQADRHRRQDQQHRRVHLLRGHRHPPPSRTTWP